jgi:hypothetical protein
VPGPTPGESRRVRRRREAPVARAKPPRENGLAGQTTGRTMCRGHSADHEAESRSETCAAADPRMVRRCLASSQS